MKEISLLTNECQIEEIAESMERQKAQLLKERAILDRKLGLLENMSLQIRDLEENLGKFAILGADAALIESFTPEFGAMAPEDYLRMLARGLSAKAVVAGENHTFGRAGRGDAAMIRDMAAELGYRAVIVPPVMDGDVVCSSTYIRALLAAGETEHASRLMAIDSAD